MEVKIWDRVSSINGIDANKILERREDIKREQEIILIEDEYGNITNIEFPNILKANLKLRKEMTALEVGQAYLEFLKEGR